MIQCPNCNAILELDREEIARIIAENRELAARVLSSEKEPDGRFAFDVRKVAGEDGVERVVIEGLGAPQKPRG